LVIPGKDRFWRRGTREAKDDATASKEFRGKWGKLVEEAKRSLSEKEEDLVKALQKRFEYGEASSQPREKFYEDIGPLLGSETEIERNAVARFLVDMFANRNEIDILRDFLLLVQVGSKSAEERAKQVSQTLETVQRIAGERHRKAQLDDEQQ